MGLLDATERTRPIMQYVWDLQVRCRALQAELHEYQTGARGVQTRYRLRWFAYGAGVGALAVWLVSLAR